jgi:hypothetical protein
MFDERIGRLYAFEGYVFFSPQLPEAGAQTGSIRPANRRAG